eukprot:m.121887 g.121887  ORF g.121887 m.121887 type:complete len:85 (-) comp13711_c2_seq3:1623-1877(-)
MPWNQALCTELPIALPLGLSNSHCKHEDTQAHFHPHPLFKTHSGTGIHDCSVVALARFTCNFWPILIILVIDLVLSALSTLFGL